MPVANNKKKEEFDFVAKVSFPIKLATNLEDTIYNLKSYKKVKITVKKNKKICEMLINAKDIPSLRASFNSITRDLSVIKNTEKVLNTKKLM